jgi:hypothetical protein
MWFQSGISPPILPCIHSALSPDLVAALIDNPQLDEFAVTSLELFSHC